MKNTVIKITYVYTFWVHVYTCVTCVRHPCTLFGCSKGHFHIMEGVVENSDGTEKAFLVSNSDPMGQGQLTGERFSGFDFCLEARGLMLFIVS